MAETQHRGDAGTAERALDVAEALAQTRGFNGFSYAHVAADLGITKASLHYHFPGKAELGEALIARYSERFAGALARIDDEHPLGRDRLEAYIDIYADVLSGQRMCLCGMLAAEYETLPAAMADAIIRFFDANQAWLTGVLESGRADGTLSFAGDAQEAAQAVIGTLEGAMLIARPYHDLARFQSAARRLLDGLT
jgi:TetR/AcrR family transcriptional regulator, transcriptional repressor for nem operon